MKILKGQTHVTPQRGMPVETLDDSQRIEDISGETAQFQYDNAGSLGNDAGEAAGTAVLFKLAQGTVLNEVGDMAANYLDSSLSFTSTALTKEVDLPNGYDGRDKEGVIERLKSLTSGLANGEYFVDYVHSIGYGVKASTQTSLTATSYKIPVRGGSASFPIGSVISQGTYNSVAPTVVDGDQEEVQMDVNGNIKSTLATLIAGEDQVNDVLQVLQKPLAASTYAFSVDQSTALEASSVIKAAPGNVYKIGGRIDATAGTATYYLQLIDAASVPADGAVTLLMAPVKIVHTTGTDTAFDIDLLFAGINGASGLVWCISSTEFTKTITGAVASATSLYK